MSEPPSTDPLIGRTVSQYEILAKLGGGAMGVVYKARDIKLGRLVALKFLPPQWSHDENAKQRFLREAQAASATNHRNICVIHNIDQTDDERLFIVMAYYDGETLKQRLERGRLSIEEATEIGSEIAEGLARAHAQGVVHRDIKPGNLMLTDDGVKILDFGLAKFADALQLTIPGSSIGTGSYMSPEQARGEEADARSDVWALGIVMFEMLTGRVPFSGAYVEATFHAIKHEALPSLRSARPDIPEALERLVMRALDKDPAGRFESARLPARDLRFMTGRSLPLELRTEAVFAPATPVSAPVPFGTSRSLIGRGTMAFAMIAVLALAGVGAFWWRARDVVRIPIVVVPVSNHTGVPDLERYRPALTYALIDELGQSPNVRVVPYLRLLEMVRPFLGRGSDPAGNEAIVAVAARSGAPFVVVPTLVYRDREADWLMQIQVRNATTGTTVASYETSPVTSSLGPATAMRLIVSAAEQVQAHFRDRGPGRSFVPRRPESRLRDPDAASAFERGLNLAEQMEYPAALQAFLESAALDGQHAPTHAWMSRLLLILNRRNEAVASAQRARTLINTDAPPWDAMRVNAILAESQGDGDAASRAYQDLAAAAPDEPWGYIELADYLKRRQDRNQEAIDAYHQVLSRDPDYVRPHVDLCQLYTRIDDHPRAESEARLAIERFKASGLRSGEAQALMCLGEAQREQGADRLPLAAENVRAARSLIEPLAQPYNLSRAVFYQALVAGTAGQLGEAAAFYEDAALRTRDVGNRVTEGLALMNLGIINVMLGQPTRSRDFYRQSREAFLAIGDERRVAEADASGAALQIEYAIDSASASRALANARTNFERLGHVDFQLSVMQSEADAYRYSGALDRARTVLRAALEIARSRELMDQVNGLAASLALVDIQAARYVAASTGLEPIVSGDNRRELLEGWLAHGVLLTRLGRFDAADSVLTQLLNDVESRQRRGLLPAVHLALGELARSRRDVAKARLHYGQAVDAWTDELPNAASVEARCRRAALPGAGTHDAAQRDLKQGIEEATRTGRVALVAECRIDAAAVAVMNRRPDDAIELLTALAEDAALGDELLARAEYWRAMAFAQQRRGESREHREAARRILDRVVASLGEPDRASFKQRPELSAILDDASSPAP